MPTIAWPSLMTDDSRDAESQRDMLNPTALLLRFRNCGRNRVYYVVQAQALWDVTVCSRSCVGLRVVLSRPLGII